jgi:hypothetical protein
VLTHKISQAKWCPDCSPRKIRENRQARYEANREQDKARRKRKHQENAEEEREYARQYYKKNREKILERERKRYKRNRRKTILCTRCREIMRGPSDSGLCGFCEEELAA